MTRFATTFVAALAGANLAAAKCAYKWRAHAGDTCDSLASDWGISTSDFISWNPSVGAKCANGVTVDQEYCVQDDGTGPDTSTPGTPTTTTSSTGTQPTGGVPSPTQDGVAQDCKAWYKVQKGDTCDAIIKKYGAFSTSDL